MTTFPAHSCSLSNPTGTIWGWAGDTFRAATITDSNRPHGATMGEKALRMSAEGKGERPPARAVSGGPRKRPLFSDQLKDTPARSFALMKTTWKQLRMEQRAARAIHPELHALANEVVAKPPPFGELKVMAAARGVNYGAICSLIAKMRKKMGLPKRQFAPNAILNRPLHKLAYRILSGELRPAWGEQKRLAIEAGLSPDSLSDLLSRLRKQQKQQQQDAA